MKTIKIGNCGSCPFIEEKYSKAMFIFLKDRAKQEYKCKLLERIKKYDLIRTSTRKEIGDNEIWINDIDEISDSCPIPDDLYD